MWSARDNGYRMPVACHLADHDCDQDQVKEEGQGEIEDEKLPVFGSQENIHVNIIE